MPTLTVGGGTDANDETDEPSANAADDGGGGDDDDSCSSSLPLALRLYKREQLQRRQRRRQQQQSQRWPQQQQRWPQQQQQQSPSNTQGERTADASSNSPCDSKLTRQYVNETPGESIDGGGVASSSSPSSSPPSAPSPNKQPWPKAELLMQKAVEARLADPSISLYDALLIGGFVFTGGSNDDDWSDEHLMYDADSVALKKRKHQLRNRLWRRQQKRLRLKDDVRMDRAVEARLADPSLSSFDALRRGGYVFPTLDESHLVAVVDRTDPVHDPYAGANGWDVKDGADVDLCDADGVTLKRRKDQLHRRLNQVRLQKLKEEEAVPLELRLWRQRQQQQQSQWQQSPSSAQRNCLTGGTGSAATTTTAAHAPLVGCDAQRPPPPPPWFPAVQRPWPPPPPPPTFTAMDMESPAGGQQVDPRMHRAVEARLADPSVSLFDALRRGGYNYPHPHHLRGVTDEEILDADKVSLQRRKDELCRRLRLWAEQRRQQAATLRRISQKENDELNLLLRRLDRERECLKEAEEAMERAKICVAQFQKAVNETEAEVEKKRQSMKDVMGIETAVHAPTRRAAMHPTICGESREGRVDVVEAAVGVADVAFVVENDPSNPDTWRSDIEELPLFAKTYEFDKITTFENFVAEYTTGISGKVAVRDLEEHFGPFSPNRQSKRYPSWRSMNVRFNPKDGTPSRRLDTQFSIRQKIYDLIDKGKTAEDLKKMVDEHAPEAVRNKAKEARKVKWLLGYLKSNKEGAEERKRKALNSWKTRKRRKGTQ